MKKRDLLNEMREIAHKAGAELVFEGGAKHEKYRLNRHVVMVPRHTEISDFTARAILKQCRAAVREGE